MSSHKVALAGATGNLGLPILTQLLAANFSVVVLSRVGSTSASKLPSSHLITVQEVDYTSVSSLKPALQGVSVVISTLSATAVDVQKPLIDASIAAGVSRFIPSEFGSDTSNVLSQALPVFGGKIATQKYLRDQAELHPGFSYTFVYNNAFFDWGLAVGFLVNPKERTATLYDSGDRAFSVTRLSAIGTAVVGVINHLNETKNRAIYVHEAVVTQNQLIDTLKRFDSSGKEWDLKHMSTKQSTADSYTELKQEKPDFGKAMYGFLPAAIYGEGHGGDFSENGKGLDNELLGVKVLTAEEAEKVVKGFVA